MNTIKNRTLTFDLKASCGDVANG